MMAASNARSRVAVRRWSRAASARPVLKVVPSRAQWNHDTVCAWDTCRGRGERRRSGSGPSRKMRRQPPARGSTITALASTSWHGSIPSPGGSCAGRGRSAHHERKTRTRRRQTLPTKRGRTHPMDPIAAATARTRTCTHLPQSRLRAHAPMHSVRGHHTTSERPALLIAGGWAMSQAAKALCMHAADGCLASTRSANCACAHTLPLPRLALPCACRLLRCRGVARRRRSA